MKLDINIRIFFSALFLLLLASAFSATYSYAKKPGTDGIRKGECGGNGPAIGYDCDGNCTGDSFTLEMIDSYGDGWNGNTISFNSMSFGFSSGYDASEVFCYDPSYGCMEIICDGGTWQSEISWTISDINGVLISGAAPYQGSLCDFSDLTQTCQNLNLSAGWSMFSTYINTVNSDFESIVSPISEEITIAKNYLGSAYLPEWGFNGIGNIHLAHGYQIKAKSDCSFSVNGSYLYPQLNPLNLLSGWNIISYLRLDSAPTNLVFSDLNDQNMLVIVKDANGAAYLPSWGFNGIGDLTPGKGYQVKTNSACQLIYLSNLNIYE